MSGKNPFPSNFLCNPSSIDGLGIIDSSQGGGGIYVHAWNHMLQIANNRIYGNTGTLTGGINIGQGEFPPQYIANGTTNAYPLSCMGSAYHGAFNGYFRTGLTITANQEQPYCFNLDVNVHHNMVTNNSSIGDELFSGTLAGSGGVSFCTGSDVYKFNYNWVCGNFSSGEGGGAAHLGFSYYGDIEHNSILFNQSLNPTIPTNCGGLMIASRGTSTILVPVVLRGVNFTGATAVNIANGTTGGLVTVSSFTVISDTQISASFSIPSNATLGNRNVTVVSPTGTSKPVVWTLVQGSLTFSAPNPTLAPTTPNTGTETGTITVTNALTGSATPTSAPGLTPVSGPGTFSITGGTCALDTVIAANGGTCTIIVQYAAGGNPGAATAYVTTQQAGTASSQISTLINAN